MKVIFGLGNPESHYQHTRHNVGVMAIEELARQRSLRLGRSWFKARVAEVAAAGQSIWIVQSQVHMNCSGEPLRDMVERLGLEAEDVLIVYDDFHLELGRLRFRRQGSSGGHRGVESVIACLGTEAVPRLRIGIGPDTGEDTIDFVLSPFTAEQWRTMQAEIGRAAEAAWRWATEGIDACMNLYN